LWFLTNLRNEFYVFTFQVDGINTRKNIETIFFPKKSFKVTSFILVAVNVKSKAEEPTAGRSPTVFASVGPSLVSAIKWNWF